MQESEIQTLLAEIQNILQGESPEEKAKIITQGFIKTCGNADAQLLWRKVKSTLNDEEVKALHYEFFRVLSQQANSAEARYLQTGDITALDESITVWEQILQHPDFASADENFQSTVLNDSAITYYKRSQCSNEGFRDLEMAISNSKKAVKKAETLGEINPKFYNHLGIWLRDRSRHWKRLGCPDKERKDLEDAIKEFEKAVAWIPRGDSSDDSLARINNLAEALRNLSERQRSDYENMKEPKDLQVWNDAIANLQKALGHSREAVEKTPLDSPKLPFRLNTLGNVLMDYYDCFDNVDDLNESIVYCQQSVKLTLTLTPKSPLLPNCLNMLGSGLWTRYKRLGKVKDLKKGIKAFKKAAQRGLDIDFEESLRSARNWLNWAFNRSAWQEVIEAYQLVKQASTRLVESQLVREPQEAWLTETQGIAAAVAYAYIQTRQLQQAVESLEENLARLLSAALRWLRADLTDLQCLAPDLHTDYQQQFSAWQDAQKDYKQASLKLAAKAYTKLKSQRQVLDNLIAQIRKTPGLENFLQPSTWATVEAVSKIQPLVYLFHGYALIIWQGKIQDVRLPKLTYKAFIRKEKIYYNAYNRRRKNKQNKQKWLTAIDKMGQWLWKVLWQPLCEKLPNQQRITLIPVGWLNLLPLHAAWTADSNQLSGRRYALDDFTISYAPNALSLQQARDLATHIQSDKLLAIDEPKPVKADPLPNSSVEVNAIIARHFTQTQLLATAHLLRHEAATQDTVKNTLNLNYNVLHFSCHGDANLANPLETGLVMAEDKMLTVQHFLDTKLQ